VLAKKREVSTMEKWVWIYRAMKRREELREMGDPLPRSDWEVIKSLLSMMFAPKIQKGDGCFSRVKNYVARMRELLDFVKANIVDQDEALTAFLLGIEVAFETLDLYMDEVKKGR
jgi:hypothetical protein